MLVDSPYRDYTALNARYIYRYVTQKSQIIVSLDALDLDDPKVKIAFQKYDRNEPAGSRVKSDITFYLPLPTALRFCHDVLDGVYYSRKVRKNPQVPDRSAYFDKYGGKAHDDGQVICTHLTLVDDNYKQTNFAFAAYAGPGEKNASTGAILPKRGCKPITSIYINMPDDDIKEMALLIDAYCRAFIQTDIESRLERIRKQREKAGRDNGGY